MTPLDLIKSIQSQLQDLGDGLKFALTEYDECDAENQFYDLSYHLEEALVEVGKMQQDIIGVINMINQGQGIHA